MGFQGQPVVVQVEEIGSVALVSVRNRTARVIDVLVDGIADGKVRLRIAGNDSFRSSYTTNGNLKIQMAGGDGAVLYSTVKV